MNYLLAENQKQIEDFQKKNTNLYVHIDPNGNYIREFNSDNLDEIQSYLK